MSHYCPHFSLLTHQEKMKRSFWKEHSKSTTAPQLGGPRPAAHEVWSAIKWCYLTVKLLLVERKKLPWWQICSDIVSLQQKLIACVSKMRKEKSWNSRSLISFLTEREEGLLFILNKMEQCMNSTHGPASIFMNSIVNLQNKTVLSCAFCICTSQSGQLSAIHILVIVKSCL